MLQLQTWNISLAVESTASMGILVRLHESLRVAAYLYSLINWSLEDTNCMDTFSAGNIVKQQ